MKRKIEDLRNVIGGKIYIYLDNEHIGKQFLKDAEAEGYRFGSIKPTESSWSDLIALEQNKQLSYVGFIGHMSFQCNGGSSGNLTRIDYKRYLNGDEAFLFKGEPLKEATLRVKNNRIIKFEGSGCFEAALKQREQILEGPASE